MTSIKSHLSILYHSFKDLSSHISLFFFTLCKNSVFQFQVYLFWARCDANPVVALTLWNLQGNLKAHSKSVQ